MPSAWCRGTRARRLAGLEREVAPLHRMGEHVVASVARSIAAGPYCARDGASDLHRAPAGRQLRGPARRRPGDRGARLRRLLPVRPLPQDGWRRRAARADRRVDHPRRPGPRHARIRLGTLVTSATFRHPGPLAISVAQVDQMSGGRVELGIGAGWYDAEHQAYAIPFPPLGERFDRLEEQLAIITGMWGTPDGGRYDTTVATTGRRLARRCPSRRSGPARRSSSVAAGTRRTPGSRPGSRPSSTCRSRRSRTSWPRRPRARRVRGIGRDPDDAGVLRGARALRRRDEAE